jgi:hypothetical protein
MRHFALILQKTVNDVEIVQNACRALGQGSVGLGALAIASAPSAPMGFPLS